MSDEEGLKYVQDDGPTEIFQNASPETFEGLVKLCKALKYTRGFVPKRYLKQKIAAINKFFIDHDLDCAVLEMSDNIDSALVLSLLVLASKEELSPLKKIIAVSLPIHCTSTIDQDIALDNAKLIIDIHKECSIIEYNIFDLTTPFIEYTKQITNNIPGSPANEKLANMVRTPMLYYVASTCQEREFKSVVVGTMNRDEGSYVGFYAKAADAMVDLQIIADIHKSEVYELSSYLNLPYMKDNGRTEEIIGAPYWFLEMYLLTLETRNFIAIRNAKIEPHEHELRNIYIENIEKIHRRNAHKYEVGLPSHFIDVISRKIFGGWQ